MFCHERFNPTLVRFCRCARQYCHHGFPRFNPTLVRFCLVPSPDATNAPYVSIPPWFDFAHSTWSTILVSRCVSIPPWFDFACSSCPRMALLCCVSIPPWFDFAAQRAAHGLGAFSGFNPTLVRFCQEYPMTITDRELGFNPTLVRFCQESSSSKNQPGSAFQSHLGSILP